MVGEEGISYCTQCVKSYKNRDAIYIQIDGVIMNVNIFES